MTLVLRDNSVLSGRLSPAEPCEALTVMLRPASAFRTSTRVLYTAEAQLKLKIRLAGLPLLPSQSGRHLTITSHTPQRCVGIPVLLLGCLLQYLLQHYPMIFTWALTPLVSDNSD